LELNCNFLVVCLSSILSLYSDAMPTVPRAASLSLRVLYRQFLCALLLFVSLIHIISWFTTPLISISQYQNLSYLGVWKIKMYVYLRRLLVSSYLSSFRRTLSFLTMGILPNFDGLYLRKYWVLGNILICRNHR
jgi:hypothetical protein